MSDVTDHRPEPGSEGTLGGRALFGCACGLFAVASADWESASAAFEAHVAYHKIVGTGGPDE